MGIPVKLADIKIKIILADIGKIRALKEEIKKKFGINYKLSMGIDILRKEIKLGNELNINLTIWDVSGEDVFEIVKDLYRKEEGMALIVFDLTKLTMLDQLIKYLSKIRQYNLKEYPYVLIGKKPFFLNKEGLYVYSDYAKKFAENEGCAYLEASSEISSDIDKAFNRLAIRILSPKVSV